MPHVTTPTLEIAYEERNPGAAGTVLAATEGKERYFPAGHKWVVARGAGHFVQREKPAFVAEVLANA